MTSRSGWPIRDPEQLPDHDEALILYHLIHQVSDTTRTSDGEVEPRRRPGDRVAPGFIGGIRSQKRVHVSPELQEERGRCRLKVILKPRAVKNPIGAECHRGWAPREGRVRA